jgi:hypothetical protein
MTDVFESPTKGEETPVTQVSDLVGEDKKFKTVEDLAKGKLEADSYIEQLKEENRIAREKLGELEGSKSKDETVSELLRAVREHQKEQQGDVKGRPRLRIVAKQIKLYWIRSGVPLKRPKPIWQSAQSNSV